MRTTFDFTPLFRSSEEASVSVRMEAADETAQHARQAVPERLAGARSHLILPRGR